MNLDFNKTNVKNAIIIAICRFKFAEIWAQGIRFEKSCGQMFKGDCNGGGVQIANSELDIEMQFYFAL